MNTSTAPTAAVVATGLAGIAVFQMALAFGAPLGRAAWGGIHTELPTRLRYGSAASAVFLSVGALIMLGRGGYWSAGGLDALFRWGGWAMALLLGLSSLANFASVSRWERFLMGPIALLLSLLCVLVALGHAAA